MGWENKRGRPASFTEIDAEKSRNRDDREGEERGKKKLSSPQRTARWTKKIVADPPGKEAPEADKQWSDDDDNDNHDEMRGFSQPPHQVLRKQGREKIPCKRSLDCSTLLD